MGNQSPTRETPPCVYAVSSIYVGCVFAMMLLVITGGSIVLVLGILALGVVAIGILIALFRERMTKWLGRR